jgi:glucose/mannose-6-phosphate isomerase
MKSLIHNFPNQLKEALTIATNAQLTQPTVAITNVVIAGLGGSGIGATILQEYLLDKSALPITVIKGYTCPASIGNTTLFIACSYSGNTEETVMTMQTAYAKGAKVVIISSGGKLIEFAKEHNLDNIQVPGGMPPRSCLGYSLTQLLQICSFFNIANINMNEELTNSINLLNTEHENILTVAKSAAGVLHKRLPIIYTMSNEGVVIRFRQQLNENSKMLCWHHVIPEMNHNELVGWADSHDDAVVVLFRNDNDYERNNIRYSICKPVFEKYAHAILEINSKGTTDIQRIFYHIHLGDWISIILSELNEVDAMNIDIINQLKGHLANN